MNLRLELLTVCVVALSKRVHSGAELMYVNERTYDDQRTDNIPKPERRSAELIVYTSALKLRAYSVRELVEPNEHEDPEGDRT